MHTLSYISVVSETGSDLPRFVGCRWCLAARRRQDAVGEGEPRRDPHRVGDGGL